MRCSKHATMGAKMPIRLLRIFKPHLQCYSKSLEMARETKDYTSDLRNWSDELGDSNGWLGLPTSRAQSSSPPVYLLLYTQHEWVRERILNYWLWNGPTSPQGLVGYAYVMWTHSPSSLLLYHSFSSFFLFRFFFFYFGHASLSLSFIISLER